MKDNAQPVVSDTTTKYQFDDLCDKHKPLSTEIIINDVRHSFEFKEHKQHLQSLLKLLFTHTKHPKGLSIRIYEEVIDIDINNFQPGEWLDSRIDTGLLALLKTSRGWLPIDNVDISREAMGGYVNITFPHHGYLHAVNSVTTWVRYLTGCRLNLPPVFLNDASASVSLDVDINSKAKIHRVDLADIESSFAVNFNKAAYLHHIGATQSVYDHIEVADVDNVDLWNIVGSIMTTDGIYKSE